MASSNGLQGPKLPHRSSDLTITEHNERAPLLSNTTSADTGGGEGDSDPTTLYVQALETHLPWYKRPSVFWLLPILTLYWITGGMVFSSKSQFQAALLCREYLNRYTTNTTSFLTNQGVDAFMLMGDTFSVAMRPSAECQVPEIQAFTAKIMGLLEVFNGLAAAFSIGYYSSLSDRHGRKGILILAFVATFLGLTALVIMDKFWDQIGFPLIILESLTNGLMGGISLALTMALAYAADCTDPAKRNVIFSWVHAALYLGYAVGPYLGGSIVKATGSILTIVYIDMAMTAFSLVFVLFFVPESLPAKQPEHVLRLYETFKRKTGAFISDKSTGSQSGGGGGGVAWHSHILHSLSFFKPNGRNTNLILLAAISFLQMLAYRGTLSVIILYTNQMFDWSEYEDGIMFSLNSLVRLGTMLVLLPFLTRLHKRAFAKKQSRIQAEAATEARRQGKQHQNHRGRQVSVDSATTLFSNQATAASTTTQPSASTETKTATVRTRAEVFSDIKFDTWMIRLGFAISSITYVGYGLAQTGWVFCFWTVLHSFCIIAAPSIKSLLTTLAEPSQFGTVLGAIQVVDSVAAVCSPLAISWVYAFTVKSMPEFVWYSLAFWAALCVVFSFMIRQKQFREGMAA
ncbi:hypothetical protein BGX34_008240 [Mortierella sp. NVP85]|nr:hypothetical protein BGX34_008240 [Mortierella sp. NVP85]